MDPTTVAQTLAAYARPARPVTPTPDPGNLAPSWVPQNVLDQMFGMPSYAENQPQWSGRVDDEPSQPPNPQIADIQRLFRGGITQNAPSGANLQFNKGLGSLVRLPGFAGFVGGEEI